MESQGYQKILKETSDARFPSFQQGFNQRWFAGNVEAIYLCFTSEGTALAFEDAYTNYGSGINIRSGGHCYEDFVYNADTKAVLDVTPMNQSGYDIEKGYWLGSGGTNWGAFQDLFRNYGKVLPSGSCYSVGLGGHICGGGDGVLSRLYGITVDWLSGVEVVVKDDAIAPAKLLYVSRESEGDEFDLYWAHTGGGGGNFGVITKYYFSDLPNSPTGAIISSLAFDWTDLTVDRIQGILDYYLDFAAQDDNWRSTGKFRLQHQATGEFQLTLHTAYFNDAERAEAKRYHQKIAREMHDICPHREVRQPMTGHGAVNFAPGAVPGPSNKDDAANDTIGDYTFYEAVQNINTSGPNQRGKYKSAYMRKHFPPNQVEAIYNHLTTIPDGLVANDMKQSVLQVDCFGGAINEKSSTATAFAQRDYLVKLQYQTYWLSPEKDAPQLKWIRDFYAEMYAEYGGTPNPANDPTDTVYGCYYNYPDVDLNDLVGRDGALWLYFLDNFANNERNLVKVKRRWDPNNIFRSKQSIPLELEG